MQLITAVAVFAGLAVATPWGPPSWHPNNQYGPPSGPPTGAGGPPAPAVTCLTSTTANNLVTGYGSLLTNYQKSVADSLLTTNFTDTSDSINWLAGIPLGLDTFSSRAALEASQSQQRPLKAFNVLAIDAVGCTTAAWRWTADVGTGVLIKGINVLYATNQNGTDAGWQINHMYSEFNNAVWDLQIGGSCSPPSH